MAKGPPATVAVVVLPSDATVGLELNKSAKVKLLPLADVK